MPDVEPRITLGMSAGFLLVATICSHIGLKRLISSPTVRKWFQAISSSYFILFLVVSLLFYFETGGNIGLGLAYLALNGLALVFAVLSTIMSLLYVRRVA